MTARPDVTAHHEAAHAVVLYRSAGFVGGEVTIVPNLEEGSAGSAVDAFGDSFNPDHQRGFVLSCYAGAHADKRFGFERGFRCQTDENLAAEVLRWHGWEGQEAALREESRLLVETHWAEIMAVAEELLRVNSLDETEVELLADLAAGSRDVTAADLNRYRALKTGALRLPADHD